MKTIVISGSRNPEGQTARAARAWSAGAAEAGADTEIHYLPAGDIRLCRQCDDEGWGICRTEGRCIIDDDFADLVDRIVAAEIVCFATPVYYADLAESLRAFLDRLRRTAQFSEAGKARIAGKAAMAICVAGGRGGGAPACCTQIDKILRTCGFDLWDAMPVRRQNLEAKCPTLRRHGRWMVRQARG
ncbi:MAG: flavodoxin family protein [Phycisphaerae bacterium]